MEMKKIITATIVVSICLLYLSYVFIVQEKVAEFFMLRDSIYNKNLIYETKLENYINKQNNMYVLLSLQQKNNREIVNFETLPRAIVSVSNLMRQNNIMENRFNLGTVGSISNEILTAPLNISGLGSYNDIMAYLSALNGSNEFFLVDRVSIVQSDMENDTFYLDLNVLIVVGEM